MVPFFSTLLNPFDFFGRARRLEYWTFIIPALLLPPLAVYIEFYLAEMDRLTHLPEDAFATATLISFALSVPTLSVTVRRLHDSGRSGFWIFVYLVPAVGFLVMLLLLVQDSDPGHNAYGRNPKA